MVGSLLTLRIDSMSYGEDAVGRHDGKVVFCFGAVPGDLVRARVLEERRAFTRAVAEEVLTPSPWRAIPPCPYFGTCGGCQWQQIEYAAQIAFKTATAREQLGRIGGLDTALVRDTLASPEPYRYRNSARLGTTQNGPAALGFRRLRSNRILRIDHCFLLPMPCNRVLFRLQDLLYESRVSGVKELTLRATGPDSGVVIVLETEHPAASGIEVLAAIPGVRGVVVRHEQSILESGNTALRQTLHGLEYQFSPHVFFQVNPRQAEQLLQLVDQHLPSSPSGVVLDGYAGAGLFSLLAARRAARVIAIEENPTAVRDAMSNASASGLTNISFHISPVERLLPRLREHFSAVILDPPRSGCHPAVLEALIARPPEVLIYVSCNPATLARDLRRLAQGGFRVAVIQPLDMFPQTYHIETVTVLHATRGQ